MKKQNTFNPGDRLLNGAIVIKKEGCYVLCVIPGNECTPYASWFIDVVNSAIECGYYHDSLYDAIKIFKDRVIS